MILGVVLAGGASSRMGVDKATVEIEGRSMLDRVAVSLEVVSDRLVVAGRSSTVSGLAGLPDPSPGRAGPLAGLAAALKEAKLMEAEAVIVVAVDHPFVRPETLARLLNGYAGRAVVPVADGIRQVTCAVYPARWEAEAMAELEASGSIQSMLDRMPHTEVAPDEWAAWGEDGRSWFSVDDLAALEVALDRYGSALE
jgi:molybdopterin-guanine dinucleotide biosynthesis protein A